MKWSVILLGVLWCFSEEGKLGLMWCLGVGVLFMMERLYMGFGVEGVGWVLRGVGLLMVYSLSSVGI